MGKQDRTAPRRRSRRRCARGGAASPRCRRTRGRLHARATSAGSSGAGRESASRPHVDLLNDRLRCLFGAITSKPKEEAAAELDPDSAGQGLDLRKPHRRPAAAVRPVHEPAPVQGVPGQSAQLRDDIDLVVFRENTEGLYAGVEFHPLPREVRGGAGDAQPKMKRVRTASDSTTSRSRRASSPGRGCQRIVRQRVRVRQEASATRRSPSSRSRTSSARPPA